MLAADQPFDDDSDGGVGRAFQGGTYLRGVPTLGILALDVYKRQDGNCPVLFHYLTLEVVDY